MRTVLAVALVASFACVACGETAAGLLAQAEALMPLRYDLGTLEAAIRLYERALALDPGNPAILVKLAQLWYEWAVLVPTEREEPGLRKAADYGFQAMGLASLASAQAMPDADFQRFLARVGDPAALLWAANGWGQLLGKMNPFSAFFALPKIRAMYERLLAVDETYFGGSPHEAYGSLLANLSDYGLLFGVKLADAKPHFERSIALDPTYLEAYVTYAKEYAVRAKDRALFEKLLKYVLAAPIGDWPFWNRHAKDKAQEYLAEIHRYFP
ncbi:tetratricopeptide repeat protein [Candidatus Bipolaricaulota bacterium]|nr:tetratricopeptide repeat protein [Candidatus Bipolaricaulota bacterium]